jgi:hypothetical protein
MKRGEDELGETTACPPEKRIGNAKSSAYVNSLFDWALLQGARLDNVEHRLSQNGIGLYATKDIEAGALVLSIPGKVVLEAEEGTGLSPSTCQVGD